MKLSNLVFILLTGCAGWPDPPAYYSIDSDFSNQQREVIRSAFDSWCDAVGYCPGEAMWSERGRIALVDSLGGKSGMNWDLSNIEIAKDRKVPDDLHALWLVIAHEVGHYCADHTSTGLMQDVISSRLDAQIDNLAVRSWYDGCPD